MVGVYAAGSGYGLYLMKSTGVSPGITFLFGLALYGAGFVVWLWILRQYPLSLAFPVAAGSLMLATQAFGFGLGEHISATRLIGVGFILAGIAFLSLEAS